MGENTDAALVEKAISGDGDSFTQLCEKYYPAMVAVAHSVLYDRHLAEDAVQQGFAQACLNLCKLKNKEKFGSWLRVICKNSALGIARKRKRIRYVDSFCNVAAKAESAKAEFPEVKKAISKLKPAERELIFLRFYNEESYDQISNVLGVTRQAINGRLRRIKQKIAIRLNGSL